MKIVTFNARCVWDKDGINSFVHREGMILDKIRTELPDVICFQEMTGKIFSSFRPSLPEYSAVFNQRNADMYGEGLAIFLRSPCMTLLGSDFFWLSETPYVPGSRYENQSQCPRVSQCAIIRDERSGKIFRVSNNHLDHRSDEARRLGIRQVLEYLKLENEKLPLPLFILGDFNATASSETIKYCESYEPIRLVDLAADVGVTLHNFGSFKNPIKIDYIYADSATASLPYTVQKWEDSLDGIYLSDHYPICADIEL